MNADSDAITLAEKLDGLPLALSTAGAYLDNLATTFADYLAMYQDSWLRLQQTSPELIAYNQALYSTWDISYKQVCRENANSALLLRFWAYFNNEDLWFEMLSEGRRTGPPWLREVTRDMPSFNSAVRVLCDYGLVEPDLSSRTRGTESRGYDMHACVHMWAVHVLNKEPDDEMARLAMQCVVAHMLLDTGQGYWIVQRRLMRHADRCLAMLTTSGVSLAEGDQWILHNLGKLYKDQGRLNDAEATYKRALQGYEKARGQHATTLGTSNYLGILYKAPGRLNDAEAMDKQALQGYKKVLGPKHTPTLNTVNNLGTLYIDQGQHNDAEAQV